MAMTIAQKKTIPKEIHAIDVNTAMIPSDNFVSE
jgi:hypothetical protein